MISPPIFCAGARAVRQRFLYSSALATITSNGQSRPIPSYPQANIPFSWPMKLAPRCLRISTFATVSGCVHILPSFCQAIIVESNLEADLVDTFEKERAIPLCDAWLKLANF